MNDLPAPPWWFAPGALATVALMTGLSVLYGALVGPVVHWSPTFEYVLYAALWFLDVNALLSARFRVVKLFFRRARQALEAGDGDFARRRVRAGAGIAYAYCVASSIYGLSFATLTGRVLLALSFSAFALLMFSVLHNHVRRALADLEGS